MLSNILLIHNQSDIRQHIINVLESHGYKLSILENIKESWQCIDEKAPDIIFIEKRLLKGPSTEAFIRICDTCQIPLVVLSEINNRNLLMNSIEKSLGIKIPSKAAT